MAKSSYNFFIFYNFLKKGLFYTKKRGVIITIAVIFAVVALSAIITKTLLDEKFDNNGTANEYTLKAYGDFLALYEGEKLEEIYEEIVISSLPALDREKFINGVTVKDIEKLDEILEDFE